MKNIIQQQNQDNVSENFTGCFPLFKNYLLMLFMVFLWVLGSVPAMSIEPVLVKDIRPGLEGTPYSSDRLQIGNILFFVAHDGVNGYELWRSDGTDDGTFMVMDIYPGSGSSSPQSLTEINGLLYFSAGDLEHGRELWRSDGTAAGTAMVGDIYQGSTSSSPAYFATLNNTLYFRAIDNISGYELWKSDGTAAGTVRVKDIYAGSSSSYPSFLTVLQDSVLVFRANDGTSGYELWTSDGTSAGTVRVKDIYPGSLSSSPGKFAMGATWDLFVFSAKSDTSGYKLWGSRGTEGSTSPLWPAGTLGEPISPNNITPAGNSLFFSASAAGDTELWKIYQGFERVADINPTGSSSPSNFILIDGILFFTANDGSNGTELWKSDGTTANTVMVMDINSGGSGSVPQGLVDVNGTLFFSATDGVNGVELWQSDGTAAGTFIYDINPGAPSSYPGHLINSNGVLTFSADNGINGVELMQLKGTISIGTGVDALSYFTIQDAVDAAIEGDVILLAPGIYTGPGNRDIRVSGKAVTIKSIMGAEQTILDLQYSGTGFIFSSSGATSSTVDGLTIRNGESYNGGAIKINDGTSPIIQNCIISDNYSSGFGGGVYSFGSSSPHFLNTRFINNVAHFDGGGAYFDSGGSITFEGCTFTDNKAFQHGGGVGSVTTIHISRSFFHNNQASGNGGGVYLGPFYEVTNSIFIGNEAGVLSPGSGSGGALYVGGTAGSLAHISLSNNSASNLGGGLRVSSGTAYLVNSIIWGDNSESGDTSGQVSVGSGATFYVYNSDLQGGKSAIDGPEVADAGIFDFDPLFAFDEDLHLLPDSPGIDAGTDSSSVTLPDTDYSGNARVIDGTGDGNAVADMGAYESGSNIPIVAITPSSINFMALAGNGPPDGQVLTIKNSGSGTLDWEVAIDQGAENWLWAEPETGSSTGETNTVVLYVDGDAIASMASGTYFATLNILDSQDNSVVLRTIPVSLTINKIITVHSNPDLGDATTIQAGIDMAENGDTVVVTDGTYHEDNISFHGKAITLKSENGPEHTIISPTSTGFIFNRHETNSSVLQGFTVTGAGFSAVKIMGNSSPTIIDCRFIDNSASYGGGIYSEGNNVVIRNCEFRSNTASIYGGGLYLTGDNTIIEGSTFTTNSADHGGGAYVRGDNTFFNETTFFDNTALPASSSGGGGGLYIYTTASETRVSNSIFNSNQSTYSGGGMLIYGDYSSIVNTVFYQNAATLNYGGGVFIRDSSVQYSEFVNCTFYNNSSGTAGREGLSNSGYYTAITNSLFWQTSGTALYNQFATHDINYTATSDSAAPAGTGNFHLSTLPFVDPGNADPAIGLKLLPTSSVIDAGTDITWLFSDNRGSYRSIDGDKDGLASFDIGAMEYSEYYGGIEGDQTTKAFANVRIDSSSIATGYGYTIKWDNRDPFPIGDRRIYQADEYTVNLALVNTPGMRHELGSKTVQVSQLGYEIPYTFAPEHIGNWQLRVEMASDPNQYVLSEPVSIEYKKLASYSWGTHIAPPAVADPTVKPDFNDDSVVFWSAETNRLYAIGGPKTLVITWYEDSGRTRPIPVVANVTYPTNPKIYVAESMAVPLLPDGTPFELVEMKFSNNDATVAANEFSATSEGWSVLLFRDNEGESADEKEVFEVIRTLPWNHVDSVYSFDPAYPVEDTLAIGTKATNNGHDDSCGDGYVFFENAFYDGFGTNKSHDRTTRQGPVFAVNLDLTGLISNENNDPLDDLVVVWYDKSNITGVCWPYLPVRYEPQWPVDAQVIYIDNEQGSGPLDPTAYGVLEDMVIYNQPDRSILGYNPNEEHAAFFTAQGSTSPGLFPLRNDINRTNISNPDTYTSDPYVLLKFINPQTGIWDMKAFKVIDSDGITPFTYGSTAGNEINAPYPLNQLVYGPCAESYTTTPQNVLQDKDSKMFSYQGDVNAGVKYFYKLQPGFYYDLDGDLIQDVSDGTCVSWLDGRDGNFDDDPVLATYVVAWPADIPTLFVGETLITAKTQTGETTGLPEVGAQCAVDVLYDEAEAAGGSVKLIDPLTEYGYAFAAPLTDPENQLPFTPRKDLSTGRWIFTALPYHIQSRLTYDEVDKELKLRGVYTSGVGEPFLLLNVLSDRELGLVDGLGITPEHQGKYLGNFKTVLGLLNAEGVGADDKILGYSSLKDPEIKALSAGDAAGTGFVTLAFNNDAECPAPTMLSVINVGCGLYKGDIKVIESPNPFEEKVTLRHNGDFGGNTDDRAFQWEYMSVGGEEIWNAYEPNPTSTITTPDGNFYTGAVETVIQGSGQQLLPDKWFRARYHLDGVCATSFSEWTEPQLYEGWIKRVMKKINLFDQKVTDFHTAEANNLASMISQAGQRFEGDIALSDSPEYLQQLGIIEVYETLLNRGNSLTADGGDFVDLNLALLFAANRLADLYMLLGNEAYADASDPTIGFSTESGQYGSEASSIFSFQNQMDSLLEEELSLLRGRDDAGVRPFYNRLIWNFTLGDGEVAYKENYNITDQVTEDTNNDTYADATDGAINEFDAKVLYPQGHGDAWGHYLSAAKKYYGLLKSSNFTWLPLPENILVAGVPVDVDYMDERKFAAVAAARAKTGAEIVNLTYRQNYTEDPEGQWQGYKDTDPDRSWGVDGWAKRAGQAAYFDWAVGNAMLPSEYMTEEQVASNGQLLFIFENISYTPGSNNLEVKVNGQLVGAGAYTETGAAAVTFNAPGLQAGDIARFRVVPDLGIKKVDRTTVVEFWDIAGSYKDIQSQVDQANVGLNPLGLAQNSIPFDIDPGLVANGQTHFEQIYSRAVQAMNNSIAVFNHANDSTRLLRGQQDSLADFQRNIENLEADYNKRLIEVYGYPYGDDCGANKTYNTSYCQTGPDLFHYMYVDGSKLMGEETPRVHEFTVTLQGNYDVTSDGTLTSEEKQVTFHVDTDSRYGIIKPPAWLAPRKASGEIQFARSDLLQLRGRFEKSLIDYQNLIEEIESQADLIVTQYGINRDEIAILNRAKDRKISINRAIYNNRETVFAFNTAASLANLLGQATAEAIPTVSGVIVGTASGYIGDLFSAGRGAALAASALLAEVQKIMADVAGLADLGHQQEKEIVGEETSIELTTLRSGFAIEQQLQLLESQFRAEASTRHGLYVQAEGLQQSGSRYLAVLAKGEQLIRDRLRFRKQTAAQIVDYRYKDMSFRIFRNDALEKYRAQFDMAGMYVYLAAKAYDYETTLLDYNTMAGQSFMTDIVKQRTIGLIQDGQPLTGSGLADPMKRMWQNFQVLKPQLGFNNPQIETNRFSLRQELLRIKMDTASNETWRNALWSYWEEDLWKIPEFRRYCRPFASEGIPQPGLVIPFTTTVTPGLNFFKWPLGGGDSYYSSTNFATKIRSVGVWFTNYNTVGLAQTPRIYLVPVGEDVLRTPSSTFKDIRTWQVIDQKLPQPFPIDTTELENDPTWIPTVNTVFDQMFELRKHSDFRAYHDSGYLNQSEMQYDSRLIGRSVWNSKWLLIIPGQSLLYDPAEGLETFIDGPEIIGSSDRTGNGIFDIKLFFETYGYSGN